LLPAGAAVVIDSAGARVAHHRLATTAAETAETSAA
jgi:hypothetical protein